MTSIAVKSIVYLAMLNSFFPKQFTVIPSLEVRHIFSSGVFLRQESSARTTPSSPTRWNPISARWDVEGGWTDGHALVGLGHVSEHGVDSRFTPLAESYDYLRLEYRMEFH